MEQNIRENGPANEGEHHVRPRHYFRYHAPRRGTVPRRHHGPQRENPHRPSAGNAGGGRHRSGLPRGQRRRLRGREGHCPERGERPGGRSCPRQLQGHRPRVGSGETCPPSAHPHLHRHFSHPHGIQAAQDARRSGGTCRGRGEARRFLHPQRGIFR